MYWGVLGVFYIINYYFQNVFMRFSVIFYIYIYIYEHIKKTICWEKIERQNKCVELSKTCFLLYLVQVKG